MIRKVDLVSYLPPFLVNFKENAVTLEAENPEFQLIWEAAEKVLLNQFVETADAEGIHRIAQGMGLTLSAVDTESQRFEILTRLSEQRPYTLASLTNSLTLLCGEDGYQLLIDTDSNSISVKLALAKKYNFESVRNMIERIVPANMKISVTLMYNKQETLTGMTHGELAAYSHDELRSDVL